MDPAEKDDEQFVDQFIQDVLDKYPTRPLPLRPRGDDGAYVVEICDSLVTTTPHPDPDTREVCTYGRWYGHIAVGSQTRWAVWEVRDDDWYDEESDTRGRYVALFNNRDEAAESWVENLIYHCEFDEYDEEEYPDPAQWAGTDPREEAHQRRRFAEMVKVRLPYWTALTGLPEDVAAMCCEAKMNPRALWETTGGTPTPEQVASYRTIAALRR